MTNNSKAPTAMAQPSNNPVGKTFYLSAGFNLPGRNGKRLTMTFRAAVTYGDEPVG